MKKLLLFLAFLIFGTTLSHAATLQLAYNNSSITQIGNIISGTAMNTGFRVNPAAEFSSFDVFFTGADTVQLNGGLYAVTGDVIATLMDTSGNVLQTDTPTLTSHVFTVQTVTYFSGLTPATTYWLHLKYNGPGVDIIQSDALVQLSGASTTPSVSIVTGYNPSQIYGWSTEFDGVIDIHAKVGLEGQVSMQTVSAGELVMASGNNSASAYGYNGGKIRFKASCTNIYVRLYNVAYNRIHLQSVPINGSSGTPTSLADFTNPETGTGYGPWLLLASGLSSSSALYEMIFQTNASGGVLLAQIMTSGGTGIDTTTTTSGLTRSQIANFIGDSITAQDYPSTYPILCWLMSNELISQNQNRGVLNAGIDGESLATMSSTAARITTITTGAVPYGGIVIREGINDIKSGSPPTVATLSGYMVSAINQIRAKGGGWATVPIYVEGIFPTSAETYYYINAYNKGAGGYQAIVAEFNAGTAAGQSPASPDLNVFYVDIDSWDLGGAGYITGGALNTTNYAGDGLHLNTLGAAIVEAKELIYLAAAPPVVFSVTVSNTGNSIAMNFTTVTGPILPATGATGLTMLVNGTSQPFTITISGQVATIIPTTTILATDIVTFNYTPGNITDSDTPTPLTLASFSGQAVTNNSTQLVAPTTAPTLTIVGIAGGVQVSASTSDTSVYEYDYIQNGGSPATGVTSPQNYTLSSLATSEVFQVRSRNSLGVGPYATISLGGNSGGGSCTTSTLSNIYFK